MTGRRCAGTGGEERRSRGARGALLLLPLLLSLAGCGPSEEEIRQARAEVQAVLEDYLPKMADAYRTGDLEPLREQLAEREIAILEKNIRNLLSQGKVMDTELLDVTIEELNMPQWANAYVTTVEHWRVTSYVAGSDVVLGHDPRQFSRVRYQVVRRGGGWLVLSRNRDPSLNP